MRRLAYVGVMAAVVAAVTSAASAAPQHGSISARVDCGTKALTFLFWPQGHNAIPSIGFPSYPYPHMEVYKPAGGAYPDQNEVAVIEFTPSGQVAGGFAKSCLPAHSKIVNSKPAKAKTTQATALTCKFPKVAQLNYQKYSTGTIAVGLTATLRSKSHTAPLEVQAYMTGGGSTLRYNAKYCKASPPPK